MNRRQFIINSGKVFLVTTGLIVAGNIAASCSDDDNDNFNGGYYDDGYYDD